MVKKKEEKIIEEIAELTAEETLTPTEVVAKEAPSKVVLEAHEKNPSTWDIRYINGELVFSCVSGRILKGLTTKEFSALLK